ncbi:MAG TPA: hypothetical protein DEH78_09760 [Solibacterales bacterium]|nr:hypothetical protein [Bryobacterales bacterium]
MDRRNWLALCGAAAWPGCSRKILAGYAFVAAEEGKALAVVDLGALAVARRIALAGAPSQVIAHQARRAVFALLPESGVIVEVDAQSLSVRRQARLATRILSMRLSPDGASLWALTAEPSKLVRLGLDGFQPGAAIPLPAGATDFDLAPYDPLAAVGFASSGRVAIADLQARATRPLVATGAGLAAVRFRSDGRQFLVTNPAERSLSILDTASGRMVTRLPLAVRPDQICFSADGGQLFITGEGMDAVVVVYPYRTEIAQTRLAGRSPGAMAASLKPGFLYVANPHSADVTIIDIQTHRVIAMTSVGSEPSFITVTPDGEYALVLNRVSGDMAIIRSGAVQDNRRKSAPLLTMIPVGSKPVSAAVMPI